MYGDMEKHVNFNGVSVTLKPSYYDGYDVLVNGKCLRLYDSFVWNHIDDWGDNPEGEIAKRKLKEFLIKNEVAADYLTLSYSVFLVYSKRKHGEKFEDMQYLECLCGSVKRAEKEVNERMEMLREKYEQGKIIGNKEFDYGDGWSVLYWIEERYVCN